MAFFEYRRSGEAAGWDFEDVDAFLRARGFLVGPGGVGTGMDGTAALVRADLDRDPTADLDAYAPPPDPQRVARGYLIGRARAIRSKAPGARTQAENDLLAVLVTIRPDL